MKICFVAPANNYHTKKWCKWFSEKGHEIHVVTFINEEIIGVNVHYIDCGVGSNDSEIKKLLYLTKALKIKKIIADINPDIVNVHYATSYGTAVALSGLKGYVLSVWGSDVYDFPKKSFIHRLMLEYSLRRAEYIFSTSKAMAIETSKYTQKNIEITPFGVDMDLFNPQKRNRRDDDIFYVGTVKTLSPKYGIDYMLKAMAIVKKENPEMLFRVRIAGSGTHENEYKKLAKKLEIDNYVTWLGYISQEKAAEEWANMDVAIIYSTLESESFGVSAVESQACGCATIISDIPGLKEATNPGKTSKVVSALDENVLANAIIELYNNKELRNKLGEMGRKYVEDRYELNDCFRNIENSFQLKIKERRL